MAIKKASKIYSKFVIGPLNYCIKPEKSVQENSQKFFPAKEEKKLKPEDSNELVLEQTKCKLIFEAVQKQWLKIATKSKKANFDAIAAFVITSDDEPDFAKVVSIGTGSGFIGRNSLVNSKAGKAVLDSHAEIIALRGLKLYLYEQLTELEKNEFKSNSDSILQLYTDESGLNHVRMKQHFKVNLYISKAPCGDGCVENPSHQTLKGKKFPNGLLRKKCEILDGTIPLPPNYFTVMARLKNGDQHCMVNSCSDKIAKWNVLGVQGTLLSVFLEPIYLSSVVVSDGYDFENMSRAFYGRIDENLLESKLNANSKFHLNRPKIGCYEGKIDISRQGPTSHSISLNWHMKNHYNDDVKNNKMEMIDSKNGEIYIRKRKFVSDRKKKRISRLAKKSLAKLYSKLLTKYQTNPSIWLNFDENGADQTLDPYYVGIKCRAVQYKKVQLALEETFDETNLGYWHHMPLEISKFSI